MRFAVAGALPEFPMERAGSAAFARGSERKLGLDAARAGVSSEALGWLHALTGPGTAAGPGGAAQVTDAILSWHFTLLRVTMLPCCSAVPSCCVALPAVRHPSVPQ